MNDTPRDWSVDIHENGRSGNVVYREASGSLSFHWEFGGGEIVAIIYVGDEIAWRQQPPWASCRRAEILQRLAAEVIRQKAAGCTAEFDDPRGWINLRQTSPPPQLTDTKAQFLRGSEAKSKIMFITAIVLLVGSVAVWGGLRLLSIRVPHGTPLGESVRATGEIATLIQTLESYVPSLHRNPSNDRYSLSLFLYPLDGSSPGRMIPLAKHLRAEESSWAKLLGSDGRNLWYRLKDLGGVELSSGKILGPPNLRAANPSLSETWGDPRRVSVDKRLHVTLADYRTVLEINPETLKATPAPVERTSAALPLTPNVQDFLCAGFRPSPTEWMGLHSLSEAGREYKPKSWLSRANRQTDAKEMRRFYRAQLGPELAKGNREILSITPLSNEEYLNAAMVRSGLGEEALRMSAPDGFLMVFTSAPGLAGTLVVARVNADGKVLWQTNTGIDRFKLSQIFPDARCIAFIGTRPAVPNKVPEPILAIIDTQSGALSPVSLWK